MTVKSLLPNKIIRASRNIAINSKELRLLPDNNADSTE